MKVRPILKRLRSKPLINEMARPAEWVPTQAVLKFPKSHGGEKLKVRATANPKRYPGLAFVSTKDNGIVVFHLPSSNPIFYKVYSEQAAKKCIKVMVDELGESMSWDVSEQEIMGSNLPKYQKAVKEARPFAKKAPKKEQAA